MKWPPLIDSGRLSWWVIARDTSATLLAWCLLLYFVRDMLWMCAYWLLLPLGFALDTPWPPGEMWRDTRPFLMVVALLVLWLATFAVVRWRLLTDHQHVASQPPPLDPARQADAFGMSAEALASLRRTSSATIRGADLDSDHGIEITIVCADPTSRDAPDRG